MFKNCNPQVIQKWQKLIQQKFEEPQRFYHNMYHINMLLQLYQTKIKHLLQQDDQEKFEYAIWFHDLVYDGKLQDNEERSAQMFQEFSQQAGLSQEIVQDVELMILDTKTHTPSQKSVDYIKLCELFLDADLSILGQTQQTYDEYARKIRKEYNHVPHDAYCQGRSKVLQNLTSKQFVFYTDYFRSNFEEQARLNCYPEIELLNQNKLI